MWGGGERSSESPPKPGQSTRSEVLSPKVANRCMILVMTSLRRRSGNERTASASAGMGFSRTIWGSSCALNSCSTQGYWCSRLTAIAVVAYLDASRTCRSSRIFSIGLTCVGLDLWYVKVVSCGRSGFANVSTVQGGRGPWRLMRCHKRLKVARRSCEMGVGVTLDWTAIPPIGVQVPRCHCGFLSCAP